MLTWTPESRRWYAEAAAVSGYHAALAAAMAPWLSPSWDVADMGCGLGFLSPVSYTHLTLPTIRLV